MADGAFVYRADTGRDKGKIVRVSVRDCPNPAAARKGLEDRFREFNPDAGVVWEKTDRR